MAGCIATIAVGVLSDKYHLRGPFVIGGCLVSLIGCVLCVPALRTRLFDNARYIVLYTEVRPGPAYAGAILAAVGVYPTIAVDLAWAGSIAGGDVRKGEFSYSRTHCSLR